MTTISQAVQRTVEFREKNGLTAMRGPLPSSSLPKLLYYAKILRDLAHELQFMIEVDPRYYWAHLQIEELGEKLAELAKGADKDPIKILDGLADSLYVLLGEAGAYDLPLEAAFDEVHASNMTKERQPDDPHNGRIRVKGPNYRPPDLELVLARYRTDQELEKHLTIDQWFKKCEAINHRSHHDEHGPGRCGPQCIIPKEILS